MPNMISDLRPGAYVTGPNGELYTVINTAEHTINIKKKICTIENSKGHQFNVPAELLTPAGKSAAEIAIRVAGTTLVTGDTVTFIAGDTIYKNYTLQDITRNEILIRHDTETVSVKINDITGISLVY